MKQIGEVTHYFNKIGVAIIKLSGTLEVGDTVTIQGGTRDFSQKVKSMQIDQEDIEKGKKGQEVGIKVKKKAPVGSTVYLGEEE